MADLYFHTFLCFRVTRIYLLTEIDFC